MSSDFLFLYDEFKQRITGIPFLLVHRKKRLNMLKLKDILENQVIENDIDLEEEFHDLENVFIPEIFGEDGIITLKNIVDKVWVYKDYLLGRITVDHLIFLRYRDNIIVIIQTNSHIFQIVRDKKTKRYFIMIYCSRTKCKKVSRIMNDILYRIGIAVSPVKLNPRRIEDIRKELDGDLLDTTLENFPSTTIDKKRIIGRGFQEDPNYIRDARLGSVNQHMFSFETPYEDKPYVVTVSDDGLVRFYNNINYKTFVDFMQDNVLYRLERFKEVIIPMNGYIIEELFEEEEDES